MIEEKHRNAYYELLDRFFGRCDALYRRGWNFPELHLTRDEEQRAFRDYGHELFTYFLDFPPTGELKFDTWVKFGGEGAVAKAQNSFSGYLYSVKIARAPFNDPDETKIEFIKEGLWREKKMAHAARNELRARFIAGIQGQKELHRRLVETPRPFHLAKLQKVLHLSVECPVYAVFRWIDGEQYDAYCKKHERQSGVRPRMLCFWRLCKLLERVHALGSIHRDLCPANILVDSAGIPTLIDMSFTKNLLEKRDLTAPGVRLGNMRWSAPEQIEDKRSDLASYASDVYSLGWLLRFSLTLRFPPDHVWDRKLRKTEQADTPSIFRELFRDSTRYDMRDRPEISEFISRMEEIFRKEGINFDPDFQPDDGLSREEITVVETVTLREFESLRQRVETLEETQERFLASLEKIARGIQDHVGKGAP